MKTLSNTSNKLFIVVGSSSVLARSISQNLNQSELIFFGRSNPFNLVNWQKSIDINTIEDAQISSNKILNHIQEISELSEYDTAHLIILSGVSSNNWIESIAVNQYFPALLSSGFINIFESQNLRDVSITLIGSAAAYLGGKAAYASTKSSLTGLMHSLNKRSDSNVRVNLVVPGAFEGNMIKDWDINKKKLVSANTVINRIASADEVSEAIIFASTNTYTADSIINMSGGQVTIE